MDIYQNIQPHKGMGRYLTLPLHNHNKIKQEEWAIRRCDFLVGGKHKNNCQLGMYFNVFIFLFQYRFEIDLISIYCILSFYFFYCQGRKYHAFAGCSKVNADKKTFEENTPGFYHSMSKEAFVVCCSLDGSSCSRKTKGGNCRSEDAKVSWKEAFEHCKAAKMRLCDSQEEIDKCCGGGCALDVELVWSNMVEGMIVKY